MLHAGLLRQNTRPTDWPALYRRLATTATDERLRRYYAAGMISGSTPLSETPLMAMDIETTGLNPERDGIVSIGLVPMSLDCIRTSESRYWLLKPRVDLTETSITIHGITHSQIARAPDLLDILDDFLQAIAGKVLVVHYRNIERLFLNGALKSRIGESISFPVIDTMDYEARLHRQKPPGWWARLLRREPPTQVSIRLADSRRRYGLPHYRPHDALTDALACAELLQAQASHHFSADTPVQSLWK